MKKMTLVVAIILVAACHKDNTPALSPMSRTDFFAGETDKQKKVQSLLNRHTPGEKLEKIESISYIDSRNKSYAIVFYRSNKRNSNLVIKREFTTGNTVAFSSSRCDGETCDCKVLTVIQNNGDVSVNCSCSSCTLLTNAITAPVSF